VQQFELHFLRFHQGAFSQTLLAYVEITDLVLKRCV
jgi:hypothetical protein